jgi:hypothetical protein
MTFDDPSTVEMVCYDLRLADYPRSKNRTRINNLFNGVPPFSNDEENKINVNPLGGTVLAHDARAQLYGAFLRPGQFFSATTDAGPRHKRSLYSEIVTSEVNRKMKRSLGYFETFRSKFAMDVLHGIGPSAWRNADKWMPDAIDIEDVGIPANTLLTMENLPFFYIYRSFTLPEIIRLTNRANVERGWNMPLVKKCIKWIDKETQALMGTNWPEVWSPEKTAERVKGDGGFYASDQVPTINVFDFYFWNDEGKESGWNRRMILDAWSEPQSSGGGVSMDLDKDKSFARNSFLFNPGNRKYADKLSELITFQFADLSAVAPFRYHSVRSLGFLIYGVCHLQNRMFCRFNESAFEATLNYLRVNSLDDADRAMKIDLINRGIIDKSVQFVPQTERWQVNASLLEMAMGEQRRIIESNSSSYTQQLQQGQSGGDRKTKFQVMAEINQTTALVQAGFNQAYRYQEEEYREILRRFFKPNSDDIDVREFQAACLRKGVPQDIQDVSYWDLQPTQVMGAGNKTMEMAISEQLLQMRNLYDPEPQREILRDVTFAITGDADKAQRWVPDQPLRVSDSVHDAELAMGALMQGLTVRLKTGMNHKEYVGTMIQELGQLVQKTEQSGGMASPQQIQGFQAIAQHIEQHLQIVSQDRQEKAFVAEAQKALSKIMNVVRAFAQRLQQQAQKQQQNGAGGDPAAAAKLQIEQARGQIKIKNAQDSHAQKTAQRQISFEKEEQRKREQFNAEQQRKNLEAIHGEVHKHVEHMHDLHLSRLKSMNESESDE